MEFDVSQLFLPTCEKETANELKQLAPNIFSHNLSNKTFNFSHNFL